MSPHLTVGSQSNPRFSLDTNAWRKNGVSCIKPGTCLTRSVMAWGQGLGGIVTVDPENPTLPLLKGNGYQFQGLRAHLRYPVFLLCNTV